MAPRVKIRPEDKGVEQAPLTRPKTRECKVCGHRYVFPCDGKNEQCMNLQWTRQAKRREKK